MKPKVSATRAFRQPYLALASEDEARAKFAYFRKAEAAIDAGPAYELAPIRARRLEPAHGTHSGYKRHLTDHTTPCRPCADARALYQREYRAKKRRAA